METDEFKKYFSGNNLYGDDFSFADISDWYAKEEEGYADLGAKNEKEYRYAYHTINKLHGYKNLALGHGLDVLSIGGAYGDELLPIIDRIRSITILEPSEQLRRAEINGIPIRYLKPEISGEIVLPDNSFDLVTCFSVLHHIPNVSFVIKEIARVLRGSGELVLREPMVSMGDWRKSRPGLTANERGIPRLLMRKFIISTGMEIKKEVPCIVKPLDLIFKAITRKSPVESVLYLRFDQLLASILYPFVKYHAQQVWEKFRPAYCFYIATKIEKKK